MHPYICDWKPSNRGLRIKRGKQSWESSAVQGSSRPSDVELWRTLVQPFTVIWLKLIIILCYNSRAHQHRCFRDWRKTAIYPYYPKKLFETCKLGELGVSGRWLPEGRYWLLGALKLSVRYLRLYWLMSLLTFITFYSVFVVVTNIIMFGGLTLI